MAIQAFVFDAYGTLYDTASVLGAVEAAFPGRGELITQIWRQKQLEYSWLRTVMRQWQDFQAVTQASLRFALEVLGQTADDGVLARVADSYNHLTPYPEARDALGALSGYKLAILSNGSQKMLDALVKHSGLDGHFQAVLSVDPKRVFKPHPTAYELIQERLGVPPDQVAFVTSNGFDIAGARAFGLNVVRIARQPAKALQTEVLGGTFTPTTMYKLLRTQGDQLGFPPSEVVESLLDLPGVVARLNA